MTMNIRRWILTLLIVVPGGLSANSIAPAATVDRDYRLGDDVAEGAVTNGAVTSTFDSIGTPGMSQLVDLTAVNTPTYRTITGRPDGVGGRGIEFNAAQSEYLHGPSLGFPEVSFSSIASPNSTGGTINYVGIADRGLQFWVKPDVTTVQTLVMDTNEHGVRINASGNFSMRYDGVDYDSNVAAAAGTWYHVEVVRPAGFQNGSRMFVNGVAAAAAPGGYGEGTSHLVVGANTDGTEDSFTGGTSEFFDGIIDDLKLFVIGVSTAQPGIPAVDFGTFNPAIDNQFIDWKLTNVAGDLNNDGVLNQTDKDDFIAGWRDKRLVNGIQVGDLTSHGQGDLNFDGITDIKDLVLIQNALPGAGLGSISAADLLHAVPEPTFVPLLFASLVPLAFRRTRRRRT
jgi:hypothetical protein